MCSYSHGSQNIKTPNVNGQFYSESPQELSSMINQFFSKIKDEPNRRRAEVLIVPHAGYVFSGGVAAYGFNAIKAHKYNTVVILAPSHYFGFSGFSVGLYDGFKTPLGVVSVDHELAKKIMTLNHDVFFEPKAFVKEHSLEVEIPFLQTINDQLQILPIVIGHPDIDSLEKFSSTLSEVIGERTDVLVVVSTDMSHFHNDNFARKMDKYTMDAVKTMDAQRIWSECKVGSMELCGSYPVVASLFYAKKRGLTDIEILKYANSSEVSGDLDRVVGYFSAVIYGKEKDLREKNKENDSGREADLTSYQKKRLIAIARDTITEYVLNGEKLEVDESDLRLKKEEGAFVTIHKDGKLRGCIGNIIGQGPLYRTIRDMAISAASKDPRFPPLTQMELQDIDLEVSVLSQPRTIKSTDEIILGTHGVIVRKGSFNQGVFLPQVAESTGWDKETFLSVLCSQKAGLPPDAWKDPQTKIEIFTAEVFSEHDFKDVP